MDQRTVRQLAFAGALLALLALLLAPRARALDQPSRLDDAAAYFSHRHPAIPTCATP
jgi:hypothetical protein